MDSLGKLNTLSDPLKNNNEIQNSEKISSKNLEENKSEISESNKSTIKRENEARKPIVKKSLDDFFGDILHSIAVNFKKNDNIPTEIIPNLFLGSVGAVLVKKSLMDNKITHIISVMDKIKNPFADVIVYKQIEIYDSVDEDIKKHFIECSDYINEVLTNSNNRILVHCFAGKSRSATIVLAYLMKYHNMTRDEALVLVKQKRSIVNPNSGFMKQLKEWENMLFNKDTEDNNNNNNQQAHEIGITLIYKQSEISFKH